jgi:hypothetical protein
MICEKAMLTAVHISMWTASKHDKQVSRDVANQHGAHQNAGRYNKQLLAEAGKLEAVRQIAGEVRQYHYKVTLPWSDDGYRILPSSLYFEHAEKMRGFKATFDEATEDFLCEYPIYIEGARQALNGLFREEDYPNPEKVREKFDLRVEILPIPTGDDFRVNLSEEEESRIRQQIDEGVRDSLSKAHRDLWLRLKDVLERMIVRLGDPKAIFRDSLVGNVVELVDLLPNLNIAQDSNLTAFVEEIRNRLCGHSPDELRRDQSTRQSTAEAAAEIMNRMAAYMGDAR